MYQDNNVGDYDDLKLTVDLKLLRTDKLAILAVKELMEEETVSEVVDFYLLAFEPKILIFFDKFKKY
jgi:hypothetical protein